MQQSSFQGRVDWLELVVGFSCNCRCRMCPSALVPSPAALSLDEMRSWLDRGRAWGAKQVWFGGGEPTLHPDLSRAIAWARRAGYEQIRIQTNGLRLSYPAYTARLHQAGLTQVSLSLKGADAVTHDAITQVPGSFERVLDAARIVREAGLDLMADVLLSAPNLEQMVSIVDEFQSIGVAEFTFWLMSLHGLQGSREARMLLPNLASAGASLTLALDRTDALGIGGYSLHLPPCVLPPRHRLKYRHAGSYRLAVVVPGAAPFMAQESPMEGGSYLPDCERCAWRPRCLGLREDYLAVHGSAGIEPIAPSSQ